MTRLLTVVAAIAFLSCRAGAETANEELHLRAKVKSVIMLEEFSGKVIPVHVDPRFALTVRRSASPENSNFAAGSVVTFAVHSPTVLFRGEPEKGRMYHFVLRRKSGPGEVRYSGLELRREPAARLGS